MELFLLLQGNTEDTTQILFRAFFLDFKGKEAKIPIITSNEEAELKPKTVS